MDTPRKSDDGFRKVLLLWAAALALCIALTPFQIHLTSRYRVARIAADAALQAEVLRLKTIDQAAINHLGTTFERARKQNDYKYPPMSEAQRLLNAGRPFAVSRDHGVPMVRWEDPVTGGEGWLLHRDGQWTGVWSISNRGFLTPQSGLNPNTGVHGAVMIGRRLLYIGLYGLWFLLLMVLLSSPRGVARVSHLRSACHMLGIALTATYLASLGPRYLRAFYDFFQDDAAAWGALSIPASVAAMIYFSRPRAVLSDAPLCPQCGYNLTGNASGRCPECGTPVGALS